VPSREWRLSAEGWERAEALATRLLQWCPAAIVSSREPKAADTAQIVANVLALPFHLRDGLQENDRTGLPYLSDDEYEQRIERFFALPDELVIGRETARQAADRFRAAVAEAGQQCGVSTLVCIAHGTVISLYVARTAGIAPFPLWKRLGLPSFVVFSAGGTIEAVVGSLEGCR